MSSTFDFAIPEETLSWLSSLPTPGPQPSSRRGPSRSSTYHESDSKYALRVTHNRRFSLATPPVAPPRLLTQPTVPEEGSELAISETKSAPKGLMDLPTEILDTIVGYAILPSQDSTTSTTIPSKQNESIITITRKTTSTRCTADDISTNAVVSKWAVTNYPSSLFLVNHTLSAITFHRVWADSAVNINLTSSDALCFLKYAISERQRAAMRRVRFPKIMLSWSDPVGGDVWLREGRGVAGKSEPGFVRDEEVKREETVEKQVRPTVSRMQSLVGLLQTRSTPVLGLVVG